MLYLPQSSVPQLTSLQQAIINVVLKYPGQFSRSGLTKMLVGAKSWQDADFPEYGRLSKYRRKDVGYQIEILLQQHYLRLDAHDRLLPNPSSARQA
jgi:hypothetical protein